MPTKSKWIGAGLLVAGLLQALSLALPWGGEAMWYLQLASMVLGVRLLAMPVPPTAKAWKVGFGRGWLWAVAWLAGSFWWLYVSMHQYGGMPSWMAALAVLLLAGAVAVFYATACAAWLSRSVGRIPHWQSALLFAALWTLGELCRGELLTGFPWGAIGYAHVNGPFAWLAPWVGVYGIGFVAAFFAAWIAISFVPQPDLTRTTKRTLALAFAMLVPGAISMAGWQLRFTQPVAEQPLSVALLQGNIAQDQKFIAEGGYRDALMWYGKTLLQTKADLLVTPETALPDLLENLPDSYWATLQQHFGASSSAALVGVPAGSVQMGLANAVVAISPPTAQWVGGTPADLALPPTAHTTYSYAKHHLVPFGEFVPLGFKWFVNMMHIPLGDFHRGARVQPRLVWQGQRIQPNICYEDLFGEELAAPFVQADTAPTVLVNVSNIAWFGNTVAIDQHRHISQMRAMELERPMVRATNTGSTAIINEKGQVQQELPRHQRGVLVGEVQGRTGTTPFAWWASRFSLWPLWGLMLAVVLLCWRRRS